MTVAPFNAQELVERMAIATNRPIRWRQSTTEEMEEVIFHPIDCCRGRGCRLFDRLWGANVKKVRLLVFAKASGGLQVSNNQ